MAGGGGAERGSGLQCGSDPARERGSGSWESLCCSCVSSVEPKGACESEGGALSLGSGGRWSIRVALAHSRLSSWGQRWPCSSHRNTPGGREGWCGGETVPPTETRHGGPHCPRPSRGVGSAFSPSGSDHSGVSVSSPSPRDPSPPLPPRQWGAAAVSRRPVRPRRSAPGGAKGTRRRRPGPPASSRAGRV